MWQFLTKLLSPKLTLFNKNIILQNKDKNAFFILQNKDKNLSFHIVEKVVDNAKIFNVCIDLETQTLNLGGFETKKEALNYLNKLYFNLYKPMGSFIMSLLSVFIIFLLASLTVDYFRPKQAFNIPPPGMAAPGQGVNQDDVKKLLDGMQGGGRPPVGPANKDSSPKQPPVEDLSENSPLSDNILKSLK